MVQFRVQAIPEWSEPELNPELFEVSVSGGGGPLLVQLPSFPQPHPPSPLPSLTKSPSPLHSLTESPSLSPSPSLPYSVSSLHIGLLVGTSILPLSETLKCLSLYCAD